MLNLTIINSDHIAPQNFGLYHFVLCRLYTLENLIKRVNKMKHCVTVIRGLIHTDNEGQYQVF